MLEARDVRLQLGSALILRGLSIEARAGEVLALCGPNGAGKSSLLSILSGERAPSGGAALLRGRALGALSPQAMARDRAVLEQHPAIDLAFTVSELVELGAAAAGPEADFDESAAAASAMERAGVSAFAKRKVRSLSGGERHRAHFARVLMQIAAGKAEGGGCALLLDEPTASLDLAHQAAVLQALRGVAAEGVAVVVVLHDLTLAAAFADRVALLSAGRLVAVGRPSEALTSERLSKVYGVEIAVDRDVEGRPLVRPVFPTLSQSEAKCTSP